MEYPGVTKPTASSDYETAAAFIGSTAIIVIILIIATIYCSLKEKDRLRQIQNGHLQNGQDVHQPHQIVIHQDN